MPDARRSLKPFHLIPRSWMCQDDRQEQMITWLLFKGKVRILIFKILTVCWLWSHWGFTCVTTRNVYCQLDGSV